MPASRDVLLLLRCWQTSKALMATTDPLGVVVVAGRKWDPVHRVFVSKVRGGGAEQVAQLRSGADCVRAGQAVWALDQSRQPVAAAVLVLP